MNYNKRKKVLGFPSIYSLNAFPWPQPRVVTQRIWIKGIGDIFMTTVMPVTMAKKNQLYGNRIAKEQQWWYKYSGIVLTFRPMLAGISVMRVDSFLLYNHLHVINKLYDPCGAMKIQ